MANFQIDSGGGGSTDTSAEDAAEDELDTDTTDTDPPDTSTDTSGGMFDDIEETDTTTGDTTDTTTSDPTSGGMFDDVSSGGSDTGGQDAKEAAQEEAQEADTTDPVSAPDQETTSQPTLETDSPGPGAPDFDQDIQDRADATFEQAKTQLDPSRQFSDTREVESIDTSYADLSESERQDIAQSYDRTVAFGATPTGGTRVFAGPAAVQAAETTVERRQDTQISQFIAETEGVDERADVVVKDGQIQLSEEGQRGFVREQFAEQFSDEVGVPVAPEDVVLEQTDDGYRGEIDPDSATFETLQVMQGRVFEAQQLERQKQVQAAALIEEETGREVDPTDVENPDRVLETLGDTVETDIRVGQGDRPDRQQTQATTTPIQATQAPGTTVQVPESEQMAAVESALQPIIGPPGETERAIGGAVAGAAQPVIGPPGAVERTVGSGVYAIGDASASAADTARETVVDPVASAVGEGAGQLDALLTRPDLVQEATETGELDTDETVEQSTEQFSRGVLQGGTELIRAPQSGIQAAELVGGGAQFTATQISEEGIDEGIEQSINAGGTVASTLGASAIRYAKENPVQTAGGIAGGYLTGAVAGRTLGTVGRAAKDRIRTAGGDYVPPESVIPQTVLEGDERFPSIADEDLLEDDPAAAVRQQARDRTPGDVQEQFREAGVTEGVTLKKTLGVEPGGPGRGRAAQGFRAPSAESDLADAYETAGTSFGPEVSPYFYEVEAGDASYSLRPGLPRFGGQPTTVFARTDVENPDAATTADLDVELREAEGETTAQAIQPGMRGFDPVEETEAQVPPGAEFADVSGGPVRNTLRRLGVGSDFYTTYQGRRIPIRTVAPESDIDRTGVPGPRDLLEDTRAQTGATPEGSIRTFELSDLRRRGGDAVDRPLAYPPSGPTADVAEGTTTQATDSDTESSETRRSETSASRQPPVYETSGVLSAETATTPYDSYEPTEAIEGGEPTGLTPSEPRDTPSEGTPSEPTSDTPSEGGYSGPSSSLVSPPITRTPSGPPSSPSGPPSGLPSKGPQGPPGEAFTEPPGSTRAPPDEPRRPRYDGDEDDDDREEQPLQVGRAETPFYYDFLDPISGETVTTERLTDGQSD